MGAFFESLLWRARAVPFAVWATLGVVAALGGGLAWALSSAKESGRAEIRTEVKIEKAQTAVAGAEIGLKTSEAIAAETSDLAVKRRNIDQEISDAVESIRLRVGAGTLVDPALSRLGVCAVVRLRNQAGELTAAPKFCDQVDGRVAQSVRPEGAAP